MNEDELRIMLARIEHFSARTAILEHDNREMEQRLTRLAHADINARDLRKDLGAAEKKIGEWAEYASQLRSIITPRRKKDLPKIPLPLDSDIPF